MCTNDRRLAVKYKNITFKTMIVNFKFFIVLFYIQNISVQFDNLQAPSLALQ